MQSCRVERFGLSPNMTVEIPVDLATTGTTSLTLPSGRRVEVPLCKPVFPIWKGTGVNTYGGKAILNFYGEPLYAELVILRIFQANGWNGVWVDTYRRKYRTGLADDEDAVVPCKVLARERPFLRYPRGFEKFSGCWDVVAWKGRRVVFCESKKAGQDTILANQLTWLECRLSEGAKVEDFLLVEWSESSCGRSDNVRFTLRENSWYAWQMLPGYGERHYVSPIKIRAVEPQKSGNSIIRVAFFNAGYASGAQGFQLDLKILARTLEYMIGVIDDDRPANERRCAIISPITFQWIQMISPDFMIRNKPTPFELEATNVNAYLDRCKAQGVFS